MPHFLHHAIAQQDFHDVEAEFYLRLIKNPKVKFRFDIVEVLLHDGAVREVRHLPNSFTLSKPYRYA